jgi:hypothetical protein
MDIMQEVAHSLLHKHTGLSAFSYIEYINQQMHLIKSNKLWIIVFYDL